MLHAAKLSRMKHTAGLNILGFVFFVLCSKKARWGISVIKPTQDTIGTIGTIRTLLKQRIE